MRQSKRVEENVLASSNVTPAWLLGFAAALSGSLTISMFQLYVQKDALSSFFVSRYIFLNFF